MADQSLPLSATRALPIPSIATLGRFRGTFILLLAAVVGALAALVVAFVGWATQALHKVLFQLPGTERLSAQAILTSPLLAIVPVIGGGVLAVTIVLARRFRTRAPVDPIEANAIHGGRMSFRESVIVTLQTLLSTSFGASVGLEAGYTQLSSAIASHLGSLFSLRRAEIRTLVGCGAAAAIAAAFDAPFSGAFYGFELIIGFYSVTLLAPLVTASLVATFVARMIGAPQTPIAISQFAPLSLSQVAPFIGLAAICSLVAILSMLAVARIEQVLGKVQVPAPLRPVLGGVVIGMLALMTPQILSTGHGALEVELGTQTGLLAVATLFGLKFLASTISLGTGFRGGLFFASLLLGALLGKLYAGVLLSSGLGIHIDAQLSAVVGMAALASGIIGGPLTMSFLVLETTGNIAISAAVLAAAGLSAFLVRETFGYSFSTWRLHLRGENIRSAHDVGRVRNLTVQTMMRADLRTVPLDTTLQAFRQTYPLGSASRVVAVDRDERYAGIILVADVYQPDAVQRPGTDPIAPLLRHRDRFLLPGLNAADAAQVFERADSEELAVLDNLGNRRVVGLLTEQHLLRRYAEELDKGLKDLTG